MNHLWHFLLEQGEGIQKIIYELMRIYILQSLFRLKYLNTNNIKIYRLQSYCWNNFVQSTFQTLMFSGQKVMHFLLLQYIRNCNFSYENALNFCLPLLPQLQPKHEQRPLAMTTYYWFKFTCDRCTNVQNIHIVNKSIH